MPVINCPNCGLVWRTADRDGAYSVQCHDCGTAVKVNTPSSTERMPRSRPQPVAPPVAVPPPFEDTRTVREAPPPVAAPPRPSQPRPRQRSRRDDYEPASGSSAGIVLVIASAGIACLLVVGVVVWLAWPSSQGEDTPASTRLASAKTDPPQSEPAKPAQPPKENPPRQRDPAPRDNPRPRNPAPRPRDPAPPAPKEQDQPTKDADFNRVFAELKSQDAFARQRAADQLCKIPPNEKREEVVKLLLEMFDESNGWPRNAGIQALGYWGTKDNGPAVMKMLDHGDIWTRKTAITALGRLNYEPAAPAIADRMTDALLRGEVTAALKMLGPAAEKPVLRYLEPKGVQEIFLCRDTCDLLKDIGTRQSVPKLESLVASNDIHIRVQVRPTAEAALKAIKQREMK